MFAEVPCCSVVRRHNLWRQSSRQESNDATRGSRFEKIPFSRAKGIGGRSRCMTEGVSRAMSFLQLGTHWWKVGGRAAILTSDHLTVQSRVLHALERGRYREQLRRLLGYLKRTLRPEQRLTVEEFYQLLQLSEAIIDYGRMIQAYCRRPVPEVIVEISELVHRFRETPRSIKDTLMLLRDMGRAEPILRGCWKLQLAGTFSSGGDGFHSATCHPSVSATIARIDEPFI
jgi:hypothetical protein